MTVSILVRDPATGALGGAAMTGNLCVGGWVLRCDSHLAIAATQGEHPSTLWAAQAFAALADDGDAQRVVARVTGMDAGRAHRQMALLTRTGRGGVFTGAANRDWKGGVAQGHMVVSGNILRGPEVLEAARVGYQAATGPMAERLLAGLRAAQAAGGDTRGLVSAALLVVGEDHPPLDLRIDASDHPLEDLAALLARTRAPAYARWLAGLPVARDPGRHGD
ncbi:DUF1028 domain-containing protein [Rhodobaculum claviforme]|uniref:DUF1028 domain-containing protein n=1 Tax=Rhodobaculum claviforme TaxID=1549854 RepID=A0A934WIC9_9RHOB|nr:DUF1028 domain-containing protein [Rhodobaculum claviforme]MBK5926759.1 hypothetical protein [Rhodobaculum claviforme]